MTPKQIRGAANTPWPLREAHRKGTGRLAITVRLWGRTKGGDPIISTQRGQPRPMQDHWTLAV